MPLLASDPISQELIGLVDYRPAPACPHFPFCFCPSDPQMYKMKPNNNNNENCLIIIIIIKKMCKMKPGCMSPALRAELWLIHTNRGKWEKQQGLEIIDLRVASNSVLFGSLVFRDILGERRKHVANIFKRFWVLPSNGRCSARRNDSSLTHTRTNTMSPTQRGRT